METLAPLNSGRNLETGSLRRIFPSSAIISTATLVTGLVMEARRKMAPVVIGFFDSRSISPCASR